MLQAPEDWDHKIWPISVETVVLHIFAERKTERVGIFKIVTCPKSYSMRWFRNCFHQYCFYYSPGFCYYNNTLFSLWHLTWIMRQWHNLSWFNKKTFLFAVMANILEVFISFLKVMLQPRERLPHVTWVGAEVGCCHLLWYLPFKTGEAGKVAL